jgi:hypothetical protein
VQEHRSSKDQPLHGKIARSKGKTMDNLEGLFFGRWLPAACAVAAIGSIVTMMPAIADRTADDLAAPTAEGASGCTARGPLLGGGCVTRNQEELMVTENDRGIVVQPIRKPPTSSSGPPSPSPGGGIKLEPRPPQTFTVSAPVRIALASGQRELLNGLTPRVPFQIVDKKEKADLVWDPQKRELTSGGDVIAHNIDRGDLPGCIERAAVSHWLEAQYSGPRQAMQVVSKERVHHKSSHIEIEMDGLQNKSLVLLNVAADGTAQYLYPSDSDPLVMTDDAYSITLKVDEPLGEDQLIAVTSSQRMPDLIRALKRIDNRRDPTQVVDAIINLGPADFAIGSAQTLSAP